MLWIVALFYVVGGCIAAAGALLAVYRISWMKVWEAGATIETELFDLLLQRAREQAAAAPMDARLAKEIRRLEADVSFLERSIEQRRSRLSASVPPDEIRGLLLDAVDAGRDPVWLLMRKEFTTPVLLGLGGVGLSTVASVWSLWL